MHPARDGPVKTERQHSRTFPAAVIQGDAARASTVLPRSGALAFRARPWPIDAASS